MNLNERLDLLRRRKSVRNYKIDEVEEKLLTTIKAEMTMINTHEAGLFFQLRINDSEPFRGFKRSYGFFRNPRNYIACVVDPNFPHTLERAGYFAEQLVIKMTELGLGTCFVGGTFDKDATDVRVRAGEQILFLILFGYEETEKKRPVMNLLTKMMHRNEPSARQYFSGDDENFKKAKEYFPQLPQGLDALMLAPSSLNKRPVRIEFSGENNDRMIRAFVDDSNQKNLIDLGIGKFNFAFATGAEWDWGNHAPLFVD